MEILQRVALEVLHPIYDFPYPICSRAHHRIPHVAGEGMNIGKRWFWSWGWVCKGCTVSILGLGWVSLVRYPTNTYRHYWKLELNRDD